MKEELTKAAQEYTDKNGHGASYVAEDFTRGAEWMLSKYNGISPDTVKEMLQALTTVYGLTAKTGNRSLEFLADVVKPVRDKAEQELKK